MRRRPRAGLWIRMSLLLLAGLAATSSTGDAASPTADRPALLLVPLNFDYTAEDYLVEGLEVLTDEIVRLIEKKGFRCERVGLVKTLRIWSEVLRDEGVSGGGQEAPFDSTRLEAARGALVRRLVAEQPVQAALLPTLLVRQGEFKNGRLKWDGVRRPIVVERGVPFDAKRLRLTGAGLGTSLWTSLYSPTGELLASRFGGIETVQSWQTSDAKRQANYTIGFNYVWANRKDLFQDEGKIRHGVKISLKPLLKRARKLP